VERYNYIIEPPSKPSIVRKKKLAWTKKLKKNQSGITGSNQARHKVNKKQYFSHRFSEAIKYHSNLFFGGIAIFLFTEKLCSLKSQTVRNFTV
jgi:hypothetical protein